MQSARLSARISDGCAGTQTHTLSSCGPRPPALASRPSSNGAHHWSDVIWLDQWETPLVQLPRSVMAASGVQAGVKGQDVRVFVSETDRFGRPSSPPESGVHTEVKKTLLFSQRAHSNLDQWLCESCLSLSRFIITLPPPYSPLISSALRLTKIRYPLHSCRQVGAHSGSGENPFVLPYSSLTLRVLSTPQGITTLQRFLHSVSRHT